MAKGPNVTLLVLFDDFQAYFRKSSTAVLGAIQRAFPRVRFKAGIAQGLKALLTQAPLAGIHVARDSDPGRKIDF